MIDIHNHLLNNVDDGARDAIESITSIKLAEEAGFTDIILTPHYIENYYENSIERMEPKVEELKIKLRDDGIKLNIHLGNEVYITDDILKLMENGENSFNDLEKVKQEIFSRNYDDNGVPQPAPQVEEYVVPEETYSRKEIEEESQTEEFISDAPTAIPRKTRRWTFKEEKDLVGYYQNGMTIEMLARLFGKDEDTIRAKLAQKGITV